MKKILEVLDGKKTYIGGGLVFLAGGLKALNVIDQEFFETLTAIGGAIAVFGLRAAVTKLFK